MANDQHIEWLKEGVDAWNRRRREDHFVPDLSGINFVRDVVDRALSNFILKRDGPPSVKFDMPQLQRLNLDGADLSRTRIEYVNLSGSILSRTNLQETRLRGVFLNKAAMINARLDRASIMQTDFVGANLGGANFAECSLTDVNFADADLYGVNFDKCDLLLTYVSGADMVKTDLVGVTYLPRTLWMARLFPQNRSPEQCPLESTVVATVGDLLDIMEDLSIHHGKNHEEIRYYFRGEPRCDKELRPSVMRDSRLAASEGEMLIDLISRRPGDFNEERSALAQWVLAQHHGLKTRFLDVTTNPLVALFYACNTPDPEEPPDGRLHVFATPRSMVKAFDSDMISIVANFAKLANADQQSILAPIPHYKGALNYRSQWEEDSGLPYETPPGELLPAMLRLYQSIRAEKPYFLERIDPRDFYRVFIVEPQRSSERIQAQAGAFLVSAFHERFERDQILQRNPDIPIYAHYELTVPGVSKVRLLDHLRSLNITRENLFPGLDESSRAVTDGAEATARNDAQPSIFHLAAELEDRERNYAGSNWEERGELQRREREDIIRDESS